MRFYPEGTGGFAAANFGSMNEIRAAFNSREIFEGAVTLCDREHNLYVELGCCRGVIPRTEGALGILEGTSREVALISRVGKTVAFRIIGFHKNEAGEPVPVLSRTSAQLSCREEYINSLSCGDIIPVRVTRLEAFGAFIDIGCGISSLIPIDMLSVSRIKHPSDRLKRGEVINAVLKSVDSGKLTFSLRELLGTWEENAALFSAGDTVTGIVRSIESYGAFVELAPNLAGLTDGIDGLYEGALISAYIKSINPQKMKIKLAVSEVLGNAPKPAELRYYVSGGHIDSWIYSPPGAIKNIISLF